MVISQEKHISADESSSGMRVDAFLAKALPELSRVRIQALLLNGDIVCDKKTLRPSHKIKGDESFTIRLPEPKPSQLIAQDLPLDILYEDADIIVVNKPAGMVVHPGAGNHEGTLVNALLHRFPGLSVGDTERPGLVHRLDKETSGVMVCARHDQAHRHLVEAFKARSVEKVYRAFCVGIFKENKFELKTGHGRHRTDRKRFTTKLVVPSTIGGRWATSTRLAHSRFEVLLSAGGVSELRVDLLTGRTHQIRAHLADIGRPLVQDSLYGGVKAVDKLRPSSVLDAAKQLQRHALHAEYLSFAHPTLATKMEFRADLPADLLMLHHALENAVSSGATNPLRSR